MDLIKLSCGSCGNSTKFSILSDGQNNATVLVIKCLECESETLIRITKPELIFDWGYEAEGILCDLG